MSKTGDYLIGKIEDISAKTGYDTAWLWARYFSVLNEFEAGEHLPDEDPLCILEKYAEAKVWGDPNTVGTNANSVPKKSYICDPYANTECNHARCVMRGGSCFMTQNRDYAGVGADGLPEEATPRKILEMNTMIISAQKNNADIMKFKSEMGKVRPMLIPDSKFQMIDPETTKIRKHTHDTLWAVMLGFGACAGLVVVIGLIIIGVLSYARG